MRSWTRSSLVLAVAVCLVALTAASSDGATLAGSISPTVRWGLIGNDGAHLAAERRAGITTKVLSLSWSAYEPRRGADDAAYIAAKRREAAALRSAGFTVILSLGVQYPPAWLLALPNARYVDQYGDRYDDRSAGSGRANFVWNPTLRTLQARYVARVFAALGVGWAAVRIGGGRFGELGYPVSHYAGHANTYWAFDANAARSNPVPRWRPGKPSPHGEAGRFFDWYIGRLTDYLVWQVRTVRASYPGRLMVLFPSFGIRPGQAAAAVRGNLRGTTSAERNGEIQRGYAFARQTRALAAFRGIVLTTTWLDCRAGDDSSSDPARWRPVHYLTGLARRYGQSVYGENTGHGTATDLRFSAAQARRYGLLGFAWYKERELLSGRYATLGDYARVISGG